MELRITEGQMKLWARARAEGLSDEIFSSCMHDGLRDWGKNQGSRVNLGLEVDFQILSGFEVNIGDGAGCDGDDVALEDAVEDVAS